MGEKSWQPMTDKMHHSVSTQEKPEKQFGTISFKACWKAFFQESVVQNPKKLFVSKSVGWTTTGLQQSLDTNMRDLEDSTTQEF